MLSLSHKFLFIHIPKTAGNSIQNSLKDYSEEKIVTIAPHHDGLERFELRSDSYEIHKHSTLRDYRRQLGNDVIDRLFKFTCVRNPWERLISYYFSPHRGITAWDRTEFIQFIETIEPVTHFVANRAVGVQGTTSDHFASMDKYIRFERLDQDFQDICKSIDIPAGNLARRNVSRHGHYSKYYDADLVEMVRNRFQDEITHFGYEFSYPTAMV